LIVSSLGANTPANYIVTPVPHSPVMVALEGSCISPQVPPPPCESSVPVMVNEFPVICTLSKIPVFVKKLSEGN
jgi:hypothetical protein